MLGFSSRPLPRPAPQVSQTVVRWFLAATVILCGLGWLGHRSIAVFEGDAQQVANAHEFIGLVHDTRDRVIAAGNDSHSPLPSTAAVSPSPADLDGVLLAVMGPQNGHTCSDPTCHAHS